MGQTCGTLEIRMTLYHKGIPAHTETGCMTRFAGYWRSLFRILTGAGAMVLMLTLAAAAQERLGGVYYGLDEAQGLTIQLQDGGNGATGRISAADGSGQAIDGRRQGGSVVSDLIFRGKQGSARITPKDLGLGITWTPQDGSGDVVFAFRRRSLELPPLPPGFQPEPYPGQSVEPHTFLASYEFWAPEAAARVYDGIEEQYRAIIRLFPVVHTDVIWKLCQSSTGARELGEALRGEGVTCAQVDDSLKASQKTNGFNRFKRRVHAERADALRAVECARGIHQPNICVEAAQRTQRAAIALETVKTVLRGL